MMKWVWIVAIGAILTPTWANADPGSEVAKSADSLASVCAEPLYNYNLESTRALLKNALETNRYIQTITLTDHLTGKRFATASRPESSLDGHKVLTRFITYRGETIGQLALTYVTTLLTLTPKERRWIKNHPKVRVGMNAWEPIAMIKSGHLDGIVWDYLTRIADRTGLTFEYEPTASWPETLKRFASKTIDLIPSIEETDPQKLRGLPTETYMQFPYVIVSRIQESYINTLKELNGKKVAVPRYGSGYAFLHRHYPQIKLLPVRTVVEALEAVKEGRAYAFVGHMGVGMYYVGHFYSSVLHIAGKTDFVFHHRMLVQPDRWILRDILNKAIDSIEPDEHQAIRNRWLHIEVKEATDYTFLYILGAVFMLVMGVTLYWNKKLSIEIEERKAVEHELALAKRDAERANSAKSAFLANMSHEIRTPINAIVGFTEFLSQEVESPRLQSYVHSIQNASHTLLRLINDILDLSKIEAGKLEIQYAPTDLAALCSEIGSVFELTLKKKHLSLQTQIDDRLPHYLMTDEIRLRQILLNLVGNAVKFTESGHIQIVIEATPVPDTTDRIDVMIAIEDTGIGIPEDQINDIFDAFKQTEGQDNRKYGGTGLGLSISKRLSEMLGGSLHVESTPGKGSRFSIHLPNLLIASAEPTSTVRPIPTAAQFAAATVLVVDDVEANRELVVRLFEKSAVRTVTASDGLEAIEQFEATQPDLILMDLRMPNMDGYAAAEAIKTVAPDLPVIALSASSMQDQQKHRFFDAFLQKPITQERLLSALSRWLPLLDSETSSTPEPSRQWNEDLFAILSPLPVADKNRLTTAYRQAIRHNSITEIDAFKQALSDTVKQHRLTALEPYLDDLETALGSFDIQAMEQLLDAFGSARKHLGADEGRP